jgi:IS5 family transposase
MKVIGALRNDNPISREQSFSHFRGRLSKEAMDVINHLILQQFSRKGLSINEGVAVDARLIQSASHPISTDEIKKQRGKRDIPQDKLDKNGKPLKFPRDLDSDGVVKNKNPTTV